MVDMVGGLLAVDESSGPVDENDKNNVSLNTLRIEGSLLLRTFGRLQFGREWTLSVVILEFYSLGLDTLDIEGF